MALDVHLQRDGDNPWGFEIFGGIDEAPLRVEKLQPNSSADKAGLQNGDTIIFINDMEVIDMQQGDARRKVAECGDSLKLGVMRGLYDPVLDDQEPICEPFEPEDSDQPSEPTEVPFKIQQFIEAPEPLQFLEPSPFNAPPPSSVSRSLTSSPFVAPAKPYRPFSTDPLEVPPIEDPIILNPNFHDQFGLGSEEMKPDDLLVSYYKDAFDKAGKETRFKLPVSDKFDPEGRTVKTELNIVKTFKYIEFIEARDVISKDRVNDGERKYNATKATSAMPVNAKKVVQDPKTTEISVNEKITDVKDVKHVDTDVSSEKTHRQVEEMDEEVRKELRYMEKMKHEIDLDKIEETALLVVDESIERAVSVAEEITNDIENELVNERRESEITKETKKGKVETHETEENEYESRKNSQNEIKEYDNIDTEVTEHEYNEREAEKSAMRRESRTCESNMQEQNMSNQQEKVIKPTVGNDEYRSYQEQETSHEDRESERVDSKIVEQEFVGREAREEFSNVTNSVNSNTKSGAEERMYTIGLQTIPNIRGVVTSTYHYDLLLKTFFIHLTDVMVALSRFILTQPVFNNEREATKMCESQVRSSEHVESNKTRMQKVVQQKPTVVKERRESKIEKDTRFQSNRVEKKVEQIAKPLPVNKNKPEKIQKDVKQMIVESTEVSKHEIRAQKETINKEATVSINKDMKQEMRAVKNLKQEKQENVTIKDNATELIEKRKISGSSMAQLSEKKISHDLTQKMDAVMAEFQTKATVDSIDMEEVTKQMMERKRRSRSRSQVEEEVMRESDPLEWLDKVDSRRASQERTEVRKEFSSTSESVENKKFESNYDRRQTRRIKSPKQTYVAIVESHVYTNTDAIFEEQVSELSETSSVQSVEEINTAFEAVQMETTENVAIDNAVRELETAKTVVEKNYLDTASSKREATVEMIQEMSHDTKEIKDVKTVLDKAIVKNDVQEVLVQESREVIEPVIDIKEVKFEKVNVDINESLTTAESQEINISESKKDITNIEEVKEETVSIVEEDYRESAIKTEILADVFTEVANVERTEPKYEVVKPEYQIVEGEEVSERVVLKSDKDKKYKVEEASAELKIVKEIVIESQAEIIEIEDEKEIVREDGVDAQSVINKLQILKSLEIDESENVTEKSMITSGLDSNVSNKQMAAMKLDSEAISQSEVSKLDQSLTQESVKKSVNQSAVSLDQSIIKESHLRSEIKQAVANSEFESSQSVTAQHSEVKRASIASEFESKSVVQSETSEQFLQAIQEASHPVKSVDIKLALDTNIAIEKQLSVLSDENNNIDTPTPSTVPPTPLVDNYVFQLTVPLPKSRGATPVPRDCRPPNEEDPHIVKKKLIPYIETTIESVLYDPPLPTPPGSKVQSPVFNKPGLRGGFVYIKPGLRGGSDRPWKNSKEEIREIERRSSLLASAIDETIKSIEEYKEEVGINTKQNVKIQEYKSENLNKSLQSSYNKKVTTRNGESHIDSKEFNDHTNEENQNGDFNQDTETKESYLVTDVDESKPKELLSKVKSKAVLVSETESIKVESTDAENKVIPQEAVVDKENHITETELIEDAVKKEVLESKPVEITEVLPKYDEVESENARQKLDEKETKTESKHTSKTESTEVAENKENTESLPGFRPVVFAPEAIPKRETSYVEVPRLELKPPSQDGRQSPYLTEAGESIGTIQGIVDGLEEAVIDAEVAKELGKPGIPEDKIAELISGESEMLREAHVMGLSRVLNSHMHRIDDSSVDFQKIKPMIGSLKDSEVLKALNEELAKAKEAEKKKEERKWTKFLQKPKRAVPKANFGYHGWTAPEHEDVEAPYKVKIVKQPKPKVAPDYKPEDFDTGPLPWEERQLVEASLPPIEPEEPILIPEEGPEFLEAIDPLPESEVPDLEDTGIPLPPVQRDPTPPIITQESPPETPEPPQEEEEIKEEVTDEREATTEEMDNRLADQLVRSVQSMVDPNATLEQQLGQMRAQLAALAQLPEVIQHTLDLVTSQLSQLGKQEVRMEMPASQNNGETYHQVEDQNQKDYSQEESQEVHKEVTFQIPTEESHHMNGNHEGKEDNVAAEEMVDNQRHNMGEEKENGLVQEMNEVMRSEKQKKGQPQSQEKQRPRACKPQPKFGPLCPEQRGVVLPGGRRWRKTEDVYNEQLIAETLAAQAELIQGKALGFESEHLPYDSRINFMKYEKPPVSLDHLQNSEVYKLVHNMDQNPLRRVDLLTPVMAESDYRERCRSMTPSMDKMNHLSIPQQFHP